MHLRENVPDGKGTLEEVVCVGFVFGFWTRKGVLNIVDVGFRLLLSSSSSLELLRDFQNIIIILKGSHPK